MTTRDERRLRGLRALRWSLACALDPLVSSALGLPAPAAASPALVTAGTAPGRLGGWLLSEALDLDDHTAPPPAPGGDPDDDRLLAASSAEDRAEAERLIALVELARGGDAEAFGMLYDHYSTPVYRFLYYRVGSVALAEDLMSETFFRALRSMSSFRWQGKDFGAWLMTIARNLTADHYKAGRTRLEYATEDMSPHDSVTEGPESSVLASLTNEALLQALTELPHEQQECLIMRFLQGLSIAETAAVLGRSEGAVKQLQLRGVRNLAKLLPEGLR
jgi:RNA polymerase sigma-70 factor (ECF subfamily)